MLHLPPLTVAKKDIRTYVLESVQSKIEKLRKYIQFTIEAGQDIKETPKYDTLREEIHEELYHLDNQMVALKKMRKELAKILVFESQKVHVGSLVITNKARFYVSVSLGEFFYDGLRMYAISPESPIAKAMMGKQIGDDFSVNGNTQYIVDIK